jgi:hypothetical protein
MRFSLIKPVNLVFTLFIILFLASFQKKNTVDIPYKFTLIPSQKFLFNSFVDCNMAEAWIGDTFRIFPGKYGEDPLWGDARDLKFANGKNADEAFGSKAHEFTEPLMPKNAKPGTKGLHGAVWFETVYQAASDKSGKTLYAVYHNENYPSTLPYDTATGEGYINEKWPQGLKEPGSAAAVCRIGIMKSTDGGRSWENRGIFIEDLQPRMVLIPHNTAECFAGGVGDPSAVASGDWLYLFFGEYGYPGTYDSLHYDALKEWAGQCISVARIKLSDLDNPGGKAKRWDGTGFNASHNSAGKPVSSLQVPLAEGGGAASSASAGFYWGPSVSWNTYLNCWVMLMAKSTSKSWKGSSLYISFNKHADLGKDDNSQKWSRPQLLVERPGHVLWYPSLQPMNTPEDIANKNTCLRLGRQARLFFKDSRPDTSEYLSEYIIRFEKQ